MKRYLHNKSYYHLIANQMGQLSPVGAFEVLAGDTVQIQNSALIRVTPLITPVMHPVTVHFLNYFVPNRILDPQDGSFKWEKFITGGEDGLYTTPPPQAVTIGIGKGTVMEHFGIEPGNRTYNTFIPKAYALIWNEDFRDQQLQAEIDIDTYLGDGDPLHVSWEKDYFTKSRIDSQLGEDTLLPLGVSAPIAHDGQIGDTIQAVSTVQGGLKALDASNPQSTVSSTGGTTGAELYADLTQATAASVNDIRKAFALQRYKEARNLYGARFTEYLRYLGISSSDARLQRPELISRGKSTINFSEVLNTASEGSGGSAGLLPLGTMGGHGIAGVRTTNARYFCEEHGHVITLMFTRPKAMYVNTQHKQFDRFTKEDYWQKELQNIGQEPVTNKELYSDAAEPYGTFGYTPRYESFKHNPSRVSGDFRDTLNSWHLARDFGSEPVLNDAFLKCEPSNRIYADTSADTDKLWCTVRNKIAVRSLLRKGIKSSIS